MFAPRNYTTFIRYKIYQEDSRVINRLKLMYYPFDRSLASVYPCMKQYGSGRQRRNGEHKKSWMMFNNNGYIHNYSKYNIEKEDFLTAFSQTEQIIHSYKSLSQ